ncbi:magnesium/cobalt transporter CorA [Oleidesulfovibrio sp.]|uniref:magnesium/cobalt transporter CorA n=1 Tax=Oleidesulfovibrio sp. TaxID=2909707 RepID=UPI003A879671
MARFLKKMDNRAGRPPGALVFVGKQKINQPRLRVIEYGTDMVHDAFVETIDELAGRTGQDTTLWCNVDGVHDAALMESMGARFGIPPLVLEDIMNTGQRPKLEEFPDVVFVSIKIPFLSDDRTQVSTEQLSAVLKEGCLLTFQEQAGVVFEPVRERLKSQHGRLRRYGADYLLYALLDCVFEKYLKTIEVLGERIELLEDDIIDDPSPALLQEITTYRREMAYLRKAVRPAREIAARMARVENGLVADSMQPYLRDLTDMAEMTADAVEVYRELLNDHQNSYNMAVGNRLNDIMKFLTIFSTIFIPLSFLAGVYGMNFENMPELHFEYGYFVLLGGMGCLMVAMLVYFRLRKWL